MQVINDECARDDGLYEPTLDMSLAEWQLQADPDYAARVDGSRKIFVKDGDVEIRYAMVDGKLTNLKEIF